MVPERAIDGLTLARWRSLCERFIAIKLGAFRNDLAADWHTLARIEPGTPGLLDEWELLEERIAELDDFGDTIVVRHWPDGGDEEEEEDWAGEETEYLCPANRCDRRVSAGTGTVPRCDLYDRPMRLPES